MKLGDGAGSFGPAAVIRFDELVADVAIADVNGDCAPDVVAGNANTMRIAVLLNTLDLDCASAPPPAPRVEGTGSFPPAPQAPGRAVGGPEIFGGPIITQVSGDYAPPLFTDLNGDGQSDLAVTRTYRNRIVVRFGDGHGSLGQARQVPVPDLTRPVAPPCNDVFVGYAGGKGMSAVAGLPTVAAGCAGVSDVPSGLAAADFDGDGVVDLATATRNGGSVAVLRGTGRGHFAAQRRYTNGPGTVPFHVTAAEVNGDRAPDVVAYGSGDDVLLLLNDGDGDLTLRETVRVGESFELRDVDGDEDLDIVALAQRPGKFARLRVLANDGRGHFSREHVEELPVQNYKDKVDGLTVADVDADGRLDAVLLVPKRRQALVLRGDQEGGFHAPLRLDTDGADPIAAVVGDVTGDGSPDIVVANQSSNEVVVLAADGSGGFEETVRFPTGGQGPFALFLDDVNDDGALDLVAMHSGSKDVFVLFGVRR